MNFHSTFKSALSLRSNGFVLASKEQLAILILQAIDAVHVVVFILHEQLYRATFVFVLYGGVFQLGQWTWVLIDDPESAPLRFNVLRTTGVQ
jgi:hypothetical protein